MACGKQFECGLARFVRSKLPMESQSLSVIRGMINMSWGIIEAMLMHYRSVLIHCSISYRGKTRLTQREYFTGAADEEEETMGTFAGKRFISK